MASQNSEDWEFFLAHLLNDPIQLSQPSTSRQHVQDETKTFEHGVQPCSDLDPQQFSLTSWKSLQLNARTLVIVF